MAQYIAFVGIYNEQIYDTETRIVTWTNPVVDKDGEHIITIKEIWLNLAATYKGRKIWRKIVK